MTTPASLNPEALAEILAELKEATLDLEYALGRIAASKDASIDDSTKALRIIRAKECRNDAAARCEAAALSLRSLARQD